MIKLKVIKTVLRIHLVLMFSGTRIRTGEKKVCIQVINNFLGFTDVLTKYEFLNYFLIFSFLCYLMYRLEMRTLLIISPFFNSSDFVFERKRFLFCNIRFDSIQFMKLGRCPKAT